MSYPDLNDKVAVITGGAAGLGAETAKAFLEEGAKVVIVDVSADALEATAADLGADEGRLVAVTADVSQESDVERYVGTAVDAFGTIDVFFNNAGIGGPMAPIVELDVSDFDKVIAVNLRGAWLGLRHVLPVMYEKRSGSVINTSSIGGLVAGPTPISPYVCSKFGIAGLTRIAATESAPYQVRVNSIHPSPADTQMMRELEANANPDDPEGMQETFAAAIPLGRYAEPRDIANLVLFLGSDASSFITGSAHRVDGGMLS